MKMSLQLHPYSGISSPFGSFTVSQMSGLLSVSFDDHLYAVLFQEDIGCSRSNKPSTRTLCKSCRCAERELKCSKCDAECNNEPQLQQQV